MMLVAAIALTSCSKKQVETEKEVPLKVTYVIECSKHLLAVCDMVVTYKGDDGIDVVDTISASPADTTWMKVWTKTVQTHKVPVKIGLDYTLVQKTDSLPIEEEFASLTAKYSIVAEKMGLMKRIIHLSENVINNNRNFFIDDFLMAEDVINSPKNLATIIDIYNDRQAYKRGSDNNRTCFLVKPGTSSENLSVKPAPWND